MKVDELIRELQKKHPDVTQSDTSNSDYISLTCVTNKGRNRKFLELPKNNSEDITWLKCHLECEIDTSLSGVREKEEPAKDGEPINQQFYFDNKIEDEIIINIAVASYNKVKDIY